MGNGIGARGEGGNLTGDLCIRGRCDFRSRPPITFSVPDIYNHSSETQPQIELTPAAYPKQDSTIVQPFSK